MADILEDLNIPKEKKKRDDLFLEKKHAKAAHSRKEHAHHQERHRAERSKETHTAPRRESAGDSREVVLRFKMPQGIMIERSVYILLILVLSYFAFINNNGDISDIFNKENNVSANVVNQPETTTQEPEVVDDTSTETTDTSTTVTDTTDDTTDDTTETTDTETEPELNGKIILTITDVDTKDTSYGGKKITGVDYTIANQKETISAELKIFVYEPGETVESIARTVPKETLTYSSLTVGTNKVLGSKALNVPPPTSPNKMKVEIRLYDKDSGDEITLDYKLVDVS
jgi:hypothetical protein